METAILVVWALGLLLALAATALVLKNVFLVVRALQDILHLATVTRDAARGVADNLSGVGQLRAADVPARRLRNAAADLAAGAGAIERRLGRPAGAGTGPGAGGGAR